MASSVSQQDVNRALKLNPSNPLIAAFYGGPGTGKSTMSTGLFHMLKLRGQNVEYVHEVAKDLTWEERWFALGHQPLIAGKQMSKYDRLTGKVDAIVTDTSTLLGTIYSRRLSPSAQHAFENWLVEDWKARNTLNVFLTRSNRPYNPNGRRQSEASARSVDANILAMLTEHEIPFIQLPATEESLPTLCAQIIDRIARSPRHPVKN